MSDDSSGAGTWLLVALALIAIAAVGTFLYVRSQRRSKWTAWFASVESETRTAVQLQLPQVLAHQDAAVRVVAWTPLRASLLALQSHWQTVADGAPDEATKLRGPQVSALLGNLVVATDSETEALTQGRDWLLLRPRVEEVQAALLGLLTEPVPTQPPR